MGGRPLQISRPHFHRAVCSRNHKCRRHANCASIAWARLVLCERCCLVQVCSVQPDLQFGPKPPFSYESFFIPRSERPLERWHSEFLLGLIITTTQSLRTWQSTRQPASACRGDIVSWADHERVLQLQDVFHPSFSLFSHTILKAGPVRNRKVFILVTSYALMLSTKTKKNCQSSCPC